MEFPADSSFEDLCEKTTRDAFDGSLLFALIETTTISNVSGVGTTQYIAYKNYDYIRETIHKDYDEIIGAIKGTKFGGPSKYYDWYKRSEYYYAVGSNEVTASETSLRLLETHTIDLREKGAAEKYVTDYTTKLSDTVIREFFEQYVKCFQRKEWFNELPHYFILVKPVSIKDEANLYIPLGNLYLVIGTDRQIDIKEYKKFVGRLQAAWFNKFGGKLLKEFSTKRISDEYKPKTALSKPLENRLSKELFKFKGKHFTLNDFFYYAFDSDEYTYLKKDYLLHSEHEFVKALVTNANDKTKLVATIKEWYDRKDDPFNILNKTATGEGLKSLDVGSIKYFLLLLSKRRLALALLLVFEFSLEEAHLALVFGERKSKETFEPKDHTVFFVNNLFITQSDPVKNIVPLLADREELFLRRIVEKVRLTKPTFKCKLPV